jgi:hypothetical protein
MIIVFRLKTTLEIHQFNKYHMNPSQNFSIELKYAVEDNHFIALSIYIICRYS